MVCSPNDNSLNPPFLGPPPVVPGFGIPFAFPQIPFPDIKLPDGIPEDLLDLLKNLLTHIPGGPLMPNMDNLAGNLLSLLASLMNQLGPYLSLYRFLQALFNMLLCIIDVLCAATNPFAMIRALRRLFKQCLPDFLNLFPWLALLAMIIALLLLLLALIEYIINQILALLKDLIANLLELAGAVQFDDSERQLAAARKIAQLLCLLEQLFTLLVAFQAILVIIQALAQLGGRSVCGAQGTTRGNDFECCPDDVCPPFILNNPDGLTGTTGHLVYHRQIDNDLSAFPDLVLPAARQESWQLYDDTTRTYNFSDIITQINGSIFWPEGQSFNKSSTVKKVPYTVDMKLTMDPAAFGHADTSGMREFQITDLVVVQQPVDYITTFNSTTTNSNGVLQIQGGKVYEADGTTKYIVGGIQANINTFIHQSTGIGVPSVEDGYNITNISYTLNINHPVLVQAALITIGCDPSLQVETALVNNTIDITAVLSRIGDLPDIGSPGPNGSGTLGCLTDSIARIRANVSIENVQAEQEVMVACLNDLKTQTLNTYNNAVSAAANEYQSTVELVPDIQFVSQPIQVRIVLKDPTGTTISFNVPADSQSVIGGLITATPTLGSVGSFVFDGYDTFVADLTSTKAGDGQLTVEFNGRVLSTILNRDNLDVNTEIIENVKTYTFVGAPAGEPAQRRDVGDIAEDS